MALLQVTRQQLEAETQLGIFRARVKISNPTLRSFMCLREGEEVHHQVQVSGWSGYRCSWQGISTVTVQRATASFACSFEAYQSH